MKSQPERTSLADQEDPRLPGHVHKDRAERAQPDLTCSVAIRMISCIVAEYSSMYKLISRCLGTSIQCSTMSSKDCFPISARHTLSRAATCAGFVS
eukprot:751957-Hanusia_phi.AAC.7